MNTKDSYKKIEVIDYNPAWANLFAKKAEQIKRIFDDNLITIHHIGSTSIPGIKAKPIIDMIPVVKDISLVDNHNQAMEEIGYQSLGEYGIIGRRYFIKCSENSERLVNAHCYQQGNDEIERYILFRDYMRNNPTEALAYSKLKEELANKYPNDIIAYMDGKDSFVKAIDKKTGFNGFSLRETKTKYDFENYHRIRKTELFTDRKDGIEYDHQHESLTNPNNTHYVFYRGSDVIGTIQIEHLDDNTVAFRLIAIDGDLKNKGYGSVLIKQSEKFVKTKGYKRILLHADRKAYNFYKKNGFTEMEFKEKGFEKDFIDMGKLL